MARGRPAQTYTRRKTEELLLLKPIADAEGTTDPPPSDPLATSTK